jgi:hypothetical protein
MKIKAILFSTFILLSGLIISCQKEKNTSSVQFEEVDPQSLSKDDAFNQYVQNFSILTENALKRFNKEQLKEITSMIEHAKSKKLTIEEQYFFIAKELQLLDELSLKQLNEVISASFSSLQRRFGKNLTKEIFVEAFKLKNNSNPQTSLVESGCGWRYTLCASAVAFEGGLLLAACEAASGGLATPLCLAGAVVYAGNGIADCHDSYCD